jgi:membrane protease YdiL (CAAX protease family)
MILGITVLLVLLYLMKWEQLHFLSLQLQSFQEFWLQLFQQRKNNFYDVLFFLVKIIVIMPIIEEFVFREILLSLLLKTKFLQKKYQKYISHFIVALAFTGLHVIIQGFFGFLVFFPAIYLGYLWQKHQSLFFNSLIHGMWNLLWIGFLSVNAL